MGGSVESDPRPHDELRRHLMAQLEYLRSARGRVSQRNVELLQGTECLRAQLRHMRRQREIMDRQRVHMEQQLLYMEEQHTTIQQQRAHLGTLQGLIWQRQRDLEQWEQMKLQGDTVSTKQAEHCDANLNDKSSGQASVSYDTMVSTNASSMTSHDELARRVSGLFRRLSDSELSSGEDMKRECNVIDEDSGCNSPSVDKALYSFRDAVRTQMMEHIDQADEQSVTASSCSSKSSELSQPCNRHGEAGDICPAAPSLLDASVTGSGKSPSTTSPRTITNPCTHVVLNSRDAALLSTNIVVSVLKASGVQVFGTADEVEGMEIEQVDQVPIGAENRAVTVSSTASCSGHRLGYVSPGRPRDAVGKAEQDVFHGRTLLSVTENSVEGFSTPSTPIRSDDHPGLAAVRSIYGTDAGCELTQHQGSNTGSGSRSSEEKTAELPHPFSTEHASLVALEAMRSPNADTVCSTVGSWTTGATTAVQGDDPYSGGLPLSRCDSMQSVPPSRVSVLPPMRYMSISEDPSWTGPKTESSIDGIQGWPPVTSRQELSPEYVGESGFCGSRSFESAGLAARDSALFSGATLPGVAGAGEDGPQNLASPKDTTDRSPSTTSRPDNEGGDPREKKKAPSCRSSWRPDQGGPGMHGGWSAKRKALQRAGVTGSKQNNAGEADDWSDSETDGLTTVMLRNIPNKYNRKQVMDEVDIKFKGKYDFFYLPIDFLHGCNVGYCFINFVDAATCQEFKKDFEGKRLNLFRSKKICTVTYGRVQGLRAILNHYFNSAVVQAQDASWRPLVLKDGVELPWSELSTAFPDIFESGDRLKSSSGDGGASDVQGTSGAGRTGGRTLPSGRRRGSKLGVTIEAQRKEMRNLFRGGQHSGHARSTKGGRPSDRAAWRHRHT
ncbi:putative RNA recognition motif 2 domain-containing protein [Neospora caninum Liverpool]|uniref:Putative RNA recognition motif 2 domain-containing protein n=1 Tax=Neospora caninum (strain Liverpool) TaxID=572307 RepID=F0VNJ3_NEOCL|nr:putative RNA recognition motif 2 domain-containing protein [Neospora caninum Liverpool]CBZ55289.1 putative RNA recognition motif 2 domain-containing protein [Neospora caninum Liverpool]CEL70021.1 TPA: RNA recognition motif 2 domain-containing protein, putative [Neospora caninum Liverpool]|eukprot:XP_003885317.1 putative RNA recognition motif 2 domain-containing protein [Neospora caninum Liverpool]